MQALQAQGERALPEAHRGDGNAGGEVCQAVDPVPEVSGEAASLYNFFSPGNHENLCIFSLLIWEIMKKTLIFAAILARGGVVHQPRLPHLLHAQEDPDQPHGEGQGHQEVRAAGVVKNQSLHVDGKYAYGKLEK